MVGADNDAIVAAEIIQRNAFHLKIVVASFEQHGEIRVVIAYDWRV
jgi:hypothetical protein